MSRDDLAFPPANAARMIWVFLLDIDESELPAYEAPADDGTWPLLGALGVKDLTPSDVEVFPEQRISEYGMVRYLTEANGMSAEEVTQDAATLESLGGVIVMVHGHGLRGKAGHFDPAHPARFVGRYQEKTTLSPVLSEDFSDVTRGIVAGGGTPGTSTQIPWRGIGLALLAVLVLAALLWSLA